MKNQQQSKSIGKWPSKLGYIPPVVYTAAVKMKLIYVYFHDKNMSDVWISEKKKIVGRYESKSIKNIDSNVCISID